MMIGVVTPRCRRSRQTSKPLAPGSMTSSRIDVPGLARRALETRRAVGGGADLVALALQAIGQREDEAGLVFDEQHALAGRRLPSRGRRPPIRRPARSTTSRRDVAAAAAGSCSVNVAPSPGDDFDRDAAAMRLGDALDQAQAEAVAVNLPVDRAYRPR